jgi:hypothetical protein
VGFHKTYTTFFPDFKGFHWQQHFHGAMMMSWLIMLIVQPFLIKYGKYKTHRTLGKLGYVLAPLVCYSLFVITEMRYLRNAADISESTALAGLAIDIPDILIFGLLYALAMINRHQSGIHARYMAGTAILMINPSLGRVLFVLGATSPIIVVIFNLLEPLGLLLLFINLRKRINIKPFLIMVILVATRVRCFACQTTIWWQKFATWFVTVFF